MENRRIEQERHQRILFCELGIINGSIPGVKVQLKDMMARTQLSADVAIAGSVYLTA